jgi:lipoprotein-releasing system permease protein
MKERLYLIFNIVLKHLSYKRKQTILVIAGVAVGSMVMILTFALANGIVSDIKNKIIDISPLITVKGEKVNEKERLLVRSSSHSDDKYYISSRIVPDEKKEIKPYTQIISLIDGVKGIDAVSPNVITKGVIRYRTLDRQCLIKGIIPDRESGIARLAENMQTGSLEELSYTSNGIILGSGLAKKIKAGYNDMVKVIGEKGISYTLKVVGTFSSGFSAVDNNNAYVNLKLAQNIMDLGSNVVSSIGIHTTSLETVNNIAKNISEVTGYKTETWEQANANLISLFERNNNITLFLVVFVFIVAGFGIANVLITLVLQKRQDIAIMKSFGLSKNSVIMIFILEGLFIGITGSLIGEVAGHFLTNFISSLPFSYGESAVVKSDHIVTVQTTFSYIITLLFSVIVSGISSYGPARRAAALNPVSNLRV